MAPSTARNSAENATQEEEKSTTPSPPKKVKQAKEDDEHIVPHNNIPLVFIALMMTAFLVCVFLLYNFVP